MRRRQRWPAPARRRPLWRSLADGLVLLALLAMVAFGADRLGWLFPHEGAFTAIDGDSLRQGAQEYRLHGIDAPELHQDCEDAKGRPYPCGQSARNELRRLVSGRSLACAVRETDRYGRKVVECEAGGENLNAAMVRSGWAIAYRRHGTAYGEMEREAKQAGRGIWQGRFDMPERWREQHRGTLMRGAATSDSGTID